MSKRIVNDEEYQGIPEIEVLEEEIDSIDEDWEFRDITCYDEVTGELLHRVPRNKGGQITLQECQAYDEVTGNICEKPILKKCIHNPKQSLCEKHHREFCFGKNLRPEGCEECDYSRIITLPLLRLDYKWIMREFYACKTELTICTTHIKIMQVDDLKDDMPYIRPPQWCPLLLDAGVTFDEVIL